MYLIKIASIKQLIVVNLAILVVFCGDGSIGGVKIIFVVLFLLSLFSLRSNSPIFNSSAACFYVFAHSSIIFLFVLIPSKDITYTDYTLWPLICSWLLVCLSNLQTNLRINFYYLIPLFLFVGVALVFGNYEAGRLGFIFGPNMLYRIVAITFMLALVIFRSENKHLLFFLTLAVFLFVLGQIGSRGGVVLALLFLSCLIPAKLLIAVIITVSLSLGSLLLYIEQIPTRMLYFGNIQNGPRFRFLSDFIYNLEPLGANYNEFSRYSADSFLYPHNILGELTFYFGLVALPILTVTLLAFAINVVTIRTFTKNKTHIDLFLSVTGLVLFTSSNFSGDMNDNLGVISISFLVVYRFLTGKNSFSRQPSEFRH